MLQRGLAYVAGTVMVCAALVQLAALILSFSSPVWVAVVALIAVVLLNSQRRRIRAAANHRSGRGTRMASGGRHANI